MPINDDGFSIVPAGQHFIEAATLLAALGLELADRKLLLLSFVKDEFELPSGF